MKIYTVATLEPSEPRDWQRTVGFFLDKAEAEEAIENGAHLHECRYTIAFIEEVHEGLYPHTEVVAWYVWNAETRRWDKVTTAPYNLEECCNFTIG